MTRQQFLQTLGFLGAGLAYPSLTAGSDEPLKSSFSGNVLIVGAGAAGLYAGYLLERYGIEYTILEASPVYGGRMKVNHSFTDFPIPLGAEWITSDHLQFSQMVNDEQVLTETKTIGYSPDDEYNIWYNGKLVRGTLNTFNYKKFVGSSWLGLFENYIIPSVEHRIQYNTPITSVTYSADEVLLASETQNFIADKVILTCPVSLLKNNEIQFNPPLPKAKQEALDKVTMWDGFKAFFEFEQKFYPAFIDYVIRPETDGQVSLYDASWGQESDRHVLGLFSVGKPAEAYRDLDDTAFKKHLLTELDAMFEGQATKHYIKHITHSWSSEAYAQGAYISDYAKPKTVSRLQKPVKNTLYFAGDAYTNGLDWGNVHNAVESASESVLNLLNH